MIRTVTILLALAAVALNGCAGKGVKAGGDVEAEKLALAKELMDLTGMDKLGPQIVQGMGKQMEKEFGEKLGEDFTKFWNDFMAELDFGALMDQMAPLYAKYFTLEELREIRDFQKSPVGRKSIRIMPEMMQDIMPLAMEWGKEMGEKAKKLAEAMEKDAK